MDAGEGEGEEGCRSGRTKVVLRGVDAGEGEAART